MIIAITIAGEIAIVGPKYGTTLVTAAILANTKGYLRPIIEYQLIVIHLYRKKR